MVGAKAERLKFLPVIENVLAIVPLFLLALFPVLEIIARTVFHSGVQGSNDYMYHSVLWVAFAGGMITSRKGEHLSLAVVDETLKGKAKDIIHVITAILSVIVTFSLFWASLSELFLAFDGDQRIGIVPVRAVVAIMPLGFFVMTFRFIFNKKIGKMWPWVLAPGLILGAMFSISPINNLAWTFMMEPPLFLENWTELFYLFFESADSIVFIVLVIGALLGTPLFVVLAGIAMVLFAGTWGSLEVVTDEAYAMLTGSAIPAIPLFTFAGFILSESKAGERFIRLFKSVFGALPGGLAVVAIVVCAFFTTFTGASGVTILALGGVLSFIMVKSGRYTKDFTNGLLTASGSIGLLFPPSLPIILYGVVAQISIKEMFIGGIVPGFVMVGMLMAYAVWTAIKKHSGGERFNGAEFIEAYKDVFLETLLPVIIIAGYFSGFFTLIETGAVAVVYALIIEVVVKRDIKLKDLPQVVLKSLPIMGGVLVLLSCAKGLSYFIVDSEVPLKLMEWAQANISSKIVFLLLLNVALLITGCLMDIFSAILVVVPLILPLGEYFGVHPVHLGIIFLANLELGYLTPPVGLNLFLASYRFEEPLVKIYRNVIPFFVILLVSVLLITYVPVLSTGLLGVFG